MLRFGANANAQNDEGDTPLILATQRGRHETVDCLLRFGANANAQNNEGDTPLIFTIEPCGSSSIGFDIVARLLVAGANPDGVNKGGNRPLHIASRSNNVAIVALLLAAGAQSDLVNNEWKTPLQLAERKPHIITLLKRGNTPFISRHSLKLACMRALWGSRSQYPPERLKQLLPPPLMAEYNRGMFFLNPQDIEGFDIDE